MRKVRKAGANKKIINSPKASRQNSVFSIPTTTDGGWNEADSSGSFHRKDKILWETNFFTTSCKKGNKTINQRLRDKTWLSDAWEAAGIMFMKQAHMNLAAHEMFFSEVGQKRSADTGPTWNLWFHRKRCLECYIILKTVKHPASVTYQWNSWVHQLMFLSVSATKFKFSPRGVDL